MTLSWGTCQGDVWCNFSSVNIDHDVFNNLHGVYIIWANSQTIKVGSGFIRDCVLKDRTNPKIASYSSAKMTWAFVPTNSIEGVQQFFNSSTTTNN
jgi:hypothetical protein